MLQQGVTRWCVWERPCLVSSLMCLPYQHIYLTDNLHSHIISIETSLHCWLELGHKQATMQLHDMSRCMKGSDDASGLDASEWQLSRAVNSFPSLKALCIWFETHHCCLPTLQAGPSLVAV
jgi:hypothetical protein